MSDLRTTTSLGQGDVLGPDNGPSPLSKALDAVGAALGKIPPATFLLALLVIGWGVRSYGVYDPVNNWMHPDENRMVMAMRDVQIPPPGQFIERFEDLNPHFFAYGSFTIYLYKFTEHYARQGYGALRREYPNPGPIMASIQNFLQMLTNSYSAGRTWTLFFGTLTILVVYLIARTMMPAGWALLAAAFLTFAVLHVQLSRFLTSDVILVFLFMVALHRMILLLRYGRVGDYLLSGVFIGMCFATKLNGVMMVAPLIVAHLIWLIRTKNFFTAKALSRWILLLVAFVLVVTTFLIIEPFAYFDFAEFYRQTREESNKVAGVGQPVPYMLQFEGTPRFIFQLEHMILWGMGLPLGLLAWAGMISCLFFALIRYQPERLFLLFYTTLYFSLVGGLQVKWMRHMLPVYPTLCLFAALLAYDLSCSESLGKARRWVGAGLGVGALAASALYTVAFLDVYRNPNTRTKASIWIYENVEKGSNVLVEHWDETLPISVRGMTGAFPGNYNRKTLENYESSSPQRLRTLAERLEWGDYYFINSKRLYHSVPRDVRRSHELRGTFYRLLFMEELGYELVKTVTSYPSIFGFELVNDLAEESFTVYDHPKASIFKNVGRLSADEILARIQNASPKVEEMTIKRMVLATEDGIPDPPMLGGLSFSVTSPERKAEKKAFKEVDTTDIVKKRPLGKHTPNPFAGGRGDRFGEFIEPRDIVLSDDGHLFVVDFRNYRIQKFKADGTFVSAFGTEGEKLRQFKDPLGITIDHDGNLLVVDTWNHRLQKFTPEGKFLAEYPEDVTFFAPTDVVVDSAGRMYVTDSGNGKIVVLNRSGMTLGEWAGDGNGPNNLREPRGLALDEANNRLFVADSGNSRVKRYSLDGLVETMWTVPGETSRPWFMALNEEGNLYVSEPINNAIFLYSPEGELLAQYQGPRLNGPYGLALGAEQLFVVEYGASRLRKVPYENFKPLAVPPAAQEPTEASGASSGQ